MTTCDMQQAKQNGKTFFNRYVIRLKAIITKPKPRWRNLANFEIPPFIDFTKILANFACSQSLALYYDDTVSELFSSLKQKIKQLIKSKKKMNLNAVQKRLH